MLLGRLAHVKRTEMILRWSVMLVLLGLTTLCSKAESTIRVHMIDVRSGLPLANNPVRLWTTGVAAYRTHPGYRQEMTDSNGVATFHVADPQPAYFYVHVGMGSAWDECSSNSKTGYVANDILEPGISKQGLCEKLPDISGKFHPGAGDVYVFVKHNTFVQRLRKAAVDPD
jgi:hypothetical protein